MKLDFDPAEFVARIGEKLVLEFEHAAVAGTPGLVGSAREHPARRQLEKLLPAFLSAGTGIVMDSFGDRSTQQDIVFFERDFCPVYSINDTPEATYFPVEGVVSIGEIKSTVDRPTLIDALDKIRSAKELKRFSQRTDDGLGVAYASYRPYGTASTFAAVQKDEYDQDKKYRDQLFGFLLCKSFRNSPDSVLEILVEYNRTHSTKDMPNIIISLDDGFIQGISLPSMNLQHAPLHGNGFAFVPDPRRAFSYLVHGLRQHAREGRSVPLFALDRYMNSLTGQLPSCRFRPFSA